MKEICPGCEKETEIEVIRKHESSKVRDEQIEVEVEYYRCTSCGEEFENLKSDYDYLSEAYRIYRKRHGMLQPEEIRNFRTAYGLGQHEISRLLGFGATTLSRYENGALQDDAHDTALRLAMEPQNLLELVEKKPDALSVTKRNRLIQKLRKDIDEDFSLVHMLEHSGNYPPDEFSGYKRFDLEKLFNAVLFFCRLGGVLKTKLNKLLFYADFKHFKESKVSITGARYAHLPFGPVPDNYDVFFLAMQKEGLLEVREEIWSETRAGEIHVALQEPEMTIFTQKEREILELVRDKFDTFTAEAIKRFSHDETGYKETKNGDLISYTSADKLQI